MVIQAIVIYNKLRHRARHLPRAPHTNLNSEREITLTRMFDTSDTICRDLLRMKIGPFQRLCARLRTYGFVDNKYVRIKEQVTIFLNTVGMTNVITLDVLLSFALVKQDVVINDTPYNSPYEKENVQPWYSFFSGAIDGTHIAAYVPLEEQGKYRNRKQVISQNVLVACTFDMKFTYVLAGSEGSAHDDRLLRSAILRQGHKLTILVGKYYLVDAGFPSVSDFLAPYRRTRYHHRDIEGQRPESSKEIDDVENVCEEDDLDSSDDEVNPMHVDVPKDETPNAHISFTNQEMWSNKRNAIVDLMWADYLPNQNAGIDFE
ncbi:uncharacterized protein LOC111406468 [Olea europaea var. sylvestris]|uniref:uncharacterized protein LOC111406468 n=1 Tax=Olea europaea var. sylvestris TaxID=158386 RepID=UPI000C1D189E|nr:uncharacterized protein LOC111406468 [Olea europaea var. sylvestris]